MTQRSFMLRDSDYGVAYEGFALHLVKEGSVVEVRDCVLEAEAEAAAADARAVQAELAVGPEEYFAVDAKPAVGSRKKAPSEFSESDVSEEENVSSDDDGGNEKRKRPVKAKNVLSLDSGLSEKDTGFTEDEQKKALQWAKRVLDYRRRAFTLKQRTWQFVDDPGSSPAATVFTFFMLLVIVFSTFTFCVETLPQYYTHETKFDDKFFIMEAVCISLFTAEFIARITTTPDLNKYFYDRMNVVDVVAIAPFYLELALANVDIPGLSVFRVVRLVRVFRLFKVSRGSLTIFVDTMARSAKPLYMLVFFTSIATIILSSLVYYAERGEWNATLGMWMRLRVWYCPVTVPRGEGPGVKDPLTYTLASGIDEPCVWVDPTTYGVAYPSISYPSEAVFTCPFQYDKGDSGCVKTYEQSPFDSIPTSFWWCLVTMTTVGYGDVVPTSGFGQFIGGIVMIFGIVVIALPITVIGSNFATIYKTHVTNETLTEGTFFIP
ncbi:ion transporter [bacterium]|nr:ion transporter [bacterium]